MSKLKHPPFRIATCKRCRKRRSLPAGETTCARCQENARREADGLCAAQLWHGPGHQSVTYCAAKAVGHPKTRSGSLLHSAVYHGNVFAEWTGRKKFTGYFDEPPTVTR